MNNYIGYIGVFLTIIFTVYSQIVIKWQVNNAGELPQEGFGKIADVFDHIAEVEQWHERRYNKLIEAIENNTVFKAPSPALWKCRNCGRVHEGTEPPDVCPSCLHPKAHFELYAENY